MSDVINVVTYVRTATAASPSESDYTPWAEFVAAVVQGRHVQIKAELETTDQLTNVSVDQLGATLELARRTESSTETTNAAATSYTFDNAFHQDPTVNITPFDLDQNQHFTLSNVSKTGFTIEFIHGGGGGSVAKQFSYTATGFGRAL